MKIPAFTSSPQSFPTGPIQVPLGISPPEVRIGAQWTGLIPYSTLPPHAQTRAQTPEVTHEPNAWPCCKIITTPTLHHIHLQTQTLAPHSCTHMFARVKALLYLKRVIVRQCWLIARRQSRCLSASGKVCGGHKQAALTIHARWGTHCPSKLEVVGQPGECATRREERERFEFLNDFVERRLRIIMSALLRVD